MPHTPRVPVRLTICRPTKRRYRRVQCAPKKLLPTVRPVGCAPPPEPWPEMPHAFTTEEEATAAWQKVVTCAEDA
eukprot:9390439-Lingulodinium_polyedra.AAC.1